MVYFRRKAGCIKALSRLAREASWRPEASASPHLRMGSSYWSAKLASAMVMRLARSLAFSDLTSVMARHVAFFLPTTAPRRALDLTMQYGTPRALQSDGSHTTISMGSTSWASTTSLAFFSSMSVVTWLMPILHETGRLEDALPPAATAAASALRRSFFSVRVSRLRSVILARWRRTYLGHLTKRVRSRPLGRMSP